MENPQPTYRTEDHLMAIMDETANWSVYDKYGQPLCVALSLRSALRAILSSPALSRAAASLCRQPGDDIILVRDQIERVAATIDNDIEATPADLLRHGTDSQ